MKSLKVTAGKNNSGSAIFSQNLQNEKGPAHFFSSRPDGSPPFFSPAVIQPELKTNHSEQNYKKQSDHIADAAGRVSDIRLQEMKEEEELQMKKKADHDFKLPVHQKESLIIQKQEVEVPSPDADDNSFEFDYELLPPELKFTLGNWMLESNTGSTELQFTHGLFKYSFGYKYGSELTAGLKTPGFGTSLGVNPDSLETSLGISSGAFKFGGSLNPETGSAGVNLGYGSPLQPMPWELQDTVMGGWSGMGSALQGFGSMQDPISFYQSHKGDINSVMKAVKAVQKSTDEESYSFGAGLKFKYNPDTGFLIHGGMQWKF